MIEPAETQELWPTEHSRSLIESLTEYLTTTFALSDDRAADSLKDFLQDPEHGMFKGPYVRLRLPFSPGQGVFDDRGRPRSLDFYPASYPPYGHQTAAFDRLTTKGAGTEVFRRPEPTLVTTGTGSGKTEAFLFPILDHVLRAKREGITGIKALILYPMNALANDQAGRLKDLILQHPELSGVRAGLYTGQETASRSVVSHDGLITNRYAMRSDPPDILLTNYKMLDQMLLRPDDASLWQASATSLQYLVLDEFHSYDGAQGTDVAMLLRRLGAALKAHWPGQLSVIPHGPTEVDRKRPLGRMTPVATSATLGGATGDAEDNPMLDFARTVFGVPFGPDAVVAETRVSVADWLDPGASEGPTPRLDAEILPRIEAANRGVREAGNTREHVIAVLEALFADSVATGDLSSVETALKAHPWTKVLLRTAHQAVSIETLRSALIPEHTVPSDAADEFISHLLAVFSHLRKNLGRNSVTVETHLWVRELSRIDSYLDHTSEYLWSDDGETLPPDATDESRIALPATFCRHCGVRGWGSMLTPDGLSLEIDGSKIREASLRRDAKFRTLMDAAREADSLDTRGLDITKVEGLRFFHTRLRTFVDDPMSPDNRGDFQQGFILAVRLHTGQDADDLSVKQACPVCDTPDAVRFVGSAVATLLSVAVTGLFGAENLDPAEKKALVFTDSVQDAAHRAGFIQSRSHTFTLRTVLRQALAHLEAQGETQPHLEQLADAVMDRADARDAADRFMLVPPDVIDHDSFSGYWDPDATQARRAKCRTAVRRRLLFDMDLEFGLQARFGRTLELTGTASVETDSAGIDDLAELGSEAISRYAEQLDLDLHEGDPIRHWVRGVLIRMRLQGGIAHPWLENYLAHEGRRWHLWGGRRRDQGMPAFPAGRSAPAFPLVGSGERPKDSGLDPVATRDAWYSWWTRRTLKVGREISGHLVRQLFEELTEAGILTKASTKDSQATVFTLPPHRVTISLTPAEGLSAKQHVLQCKACQARTFGTVRVVKEMTDAPCLNLRCQGVLAPISLSSTNYYRSTLYGAEHTSRVIAREHSSLLPDEVRLDYEEQFRRDDTAPDSPNVLVATPTLEMGIDIGSLSTVMLSSMPRSVASYVQRVGRAGRLSGNSLALAFVRGRGQHLPKLHDPLSIINGEVRPPATYLDADEILRRQFLAYCADILARTPGSEQPRNLTDALRSTEADTYLGRIMSLVRSGGQDVVEGFLETFGAELSQAAGNRLRDWVVPGDHHQGDTPFETRLHAASRRYGEDLLEESSRKDRLISVVLPQLREEVEVAERIADESSKTVAEARRNLRIAQGALRRIEAQIEQMTTKDWWISGLERYGLLPNYTLVEDSVTLDARVSWRDEASGDWQAEVYAFERSSESALRDFAPGSTFYAQGMELMVDAVELGHDQRELAHWQLCPECGWINKNLSPRTGGESEPQRWNLVPECPRCASPAIGDTGQVLPVVELTKVSSEVHRDEALISDRTEERRRTSYEIRVAADIDPATVRGCWYVKDFAFGADLLPAVTLRWLNLGPRGHSAAKRVIAGQEVQAPLFKICPACGTRETNPWVNHPGDHRYWCEHRKSAEKHLEQIALARELETQGVLLHLPAELVEDDYTIPTLKAAVMLGLYEGFGGTPEHLGVIDVPESTKLSQRGYSSMTLLLHDNVPGGTGYLAEFSDHRRVHRLLRAAWEVVSSCDCDAEEQGDQKRLACHRCLLPFADYHSFDRVSRSAAARILSTLLAGGQEQRDQEQPWEVTDEPPVTEGAAESALERQFRDALRARLETEGVPVTESMRGGFLTLSFQVPGQRGGWQLTPQVRLGNTQPDFVLERPGTVSIAIYTDGRHYHASAAHNRVADDAEKRHGLRARGGYLPWAITHEDILAFRGGGESSERALGLGVLNEQILAGLRKQGALDERLLRAARSSALHLLWEWIHRPDESAFAQFAHAMSLATLRRETAQQLHSLEDKQPLDGLRIDPSVLSYRLRLGGRDTDRWWHQSLGSTDLVAAGSPGNPAEIRIVYLLNDSPEALAEPHFAPQWREWLMFSNVLGFRAPHTTAVLTRASAETILAADYTAVEAEVPAVVPASADLSQGPRLPADWQPLVEDPMLSDEERQLLSALAAEGAPLPELGEEYADGTMVDIAWPDRGIAVLMEDGEAGRDSLGAAGWRVLVKPELSAVLEELRR